jgi:hypothetical protein
MDSRLAKGASRRAGSGHHEDRQACAGLMIRLLGRWFF